MKISASMLASNPLYLGDFIKQCEEGKVDIIHIDIMDGHYVNNFTFGVETVYQICSNTKIPVEAHLEISNPEAHIESFAKAGADIITVHLDTCVHPIRVLESIKKNNASAGLAINPHIGLEAAGYLEDYIDYLLLLSVEPGFGGQKFQQGTYRKIETAKKMFNRYIPIGVDGGVNKENIVRLAEAGAEVFIIGTALCSDGNFQDNLKGFKELLSGRALA